MRKVIMFTVGMIFSFNVLAASPCVRMENFVTLGEFAGQCNTDFKKEGKKAFETSKACLATAKYNQQAGMASVAIMSATTPGLYAHCMNAQMKGFNAAVQNLEIWNKNRNKGLSQKQIDEKAILEYLGN